LGLGFHISGPYCYGESYISDIYKVHGNLPHLVLYFILILIFSKSRW
jgi:hypothetical protein